MEKHGQTICLNMIVKNEAHVIRRCLDSVREFIDHWVIVDTGSTDGTQDVIREHLKDLPGQLVERPWVNFAHNRSEALEYARGKTDYVFIIDADEILEFDEDFRLEPLTKDAYLFQMISGGYSYYKTQLVNNSLNWCFKNVLHEYIYSEEAETEDILPGVRTHRLPDGARSRDPNTYRKDALILENALIDEPDNSRYVFYLAQSYRDANEPDLAIRNYQKRVEMGGWVEEVWYSLYQIAEIKHRMGTDWPEVLEAYLTAFQYKPDRAGPLYKIGAHYQYLKQYNSAYLFFNQAMSIPFPKDDRLFIEKTLYDYMLPLEYAVTCFYVGKHDQAIEINNRLLCGDELPPHLIEQVIQNRRFSLDVLCPPKQSPSERTNKIKVCVMIETPGPFLDNCVESLLFQDYQAFEMIFIDNGANQDWARKIPPDDPRITLIHSDTPRGWTACLDECLTRYCEPDDIIFPLDGNDWLENVDSLSMVNQLFNKYEPMILYGQYRYSSGHLGHTIPFSGEAAFAALREFWHFFNPFIFRAALYRELTGFDPELNCLKDDKGLWLNDVGANALYYALLETAGLRRSCFNDSTLTVFNLDSPRAKEVELSESEAVRLCERIRFKTIKPSKETA